MSLLEVKGLCKDFGGVRAVNNLNFSLEKGEILGLIGPNGAGKTTAFNMIAGYFPPDQGEIYFQGTPITGLRPWDVCRLGIARTFQLSKPFGELSLIENVMVGGFAETSDRRLARQRAEEVLEFLAMSEQMDIEAHNLTVFDRKKLELGRALATSPELLLLDEVVAGATPNEAGDMMELIRRIRASGVTVLIVEHVMKVIMGLSDRVVVLNYGEKLADCSPEDAACNPDILKAYLGDRYVGAASSST